MFVCSSSSIKFKLFPATAWIEQYELLDQYMGHTGALPDDVQQSTLSGWFMVIEIARYRRRLAAANPFIQTIIPDILSLSSSTPG